MPTAARWFVRAFILLPVQIKEFRQIACLVERGLISGQGDRCEKRFV